MPFYLNDVDAVSSNRHSPDTWMDGWMDGWVASSVAGGRTQRVDRDGPLIRHVRTGSKVKARLTTDRDMLLLLG